MKEDRCFDAGKPILGAQMDGTTRIQSIIIKLNTELFRGVKQWITKEKTSNLPCNSTPVSVLGRLMILPARERLMLLTWVFPRSQAIYLIFWIYKPFASERNRTCVKLLYWVNEQRGKKKWSQHKDPQSTSEEIHVLVSPSGLWMG